jgi:hypothetical protein
MKGIAMAFTKALYYPWIDIHDESWLKNAILYWDSIQTIVPRLMDTPYKKDFSIQCADEGILKPLYVQSDMEEINDLADDVIRYLSSSKAVELILSKENHSHIGINTSCLPETFDNLIRLGSDKMPYEVRNMIGRFNLFGEKAEDELWFRVDPRFADFYMTLLATKLSENRGIGLLTPLDVGSRLSTMVKLEGSLHDVAAGNRRSLKEIPKALAQGVLSHFVFEGISIRPEISIKKIIKFRKKRADELRRFRIEIEGLTKSIDFKRPIDAIRQQVSDIYGNKVVPAMTDLKESLTDAKIGWLTRDLLKIACFSIPPTSGPLALMGLSVPIAIMAGAGISIVASGVLYNRGKKKILRENPYSYLLAAEKKLT